MTTVTTTLPTTAPRLSLWLALWLASAAVLGCGPDQARTPATATDAATVDSATGADVAATDASADEPPTPIPADLSRDLLHLDLQLDLQSHVGVATWQVAAAPAGGSVSFEVGGLTDITVESGHEAQRVGPLLHVRLPPAPGPAKVKLRYGFSEKDSMTGLMTAGSSVTWPRHCQNLFPCHSAPAEGITFSLAVSGLPNGHVAVLPAEVTQQVPTYDVALAHGDYSYHKVGVAPSGLELGLWLKPNQVDAALAGTKDWPKAVAWLEKTLGPYPLGKKLAAVSVPWGPLAYGGLEMHPIYHVSDLAIGDLAIHSHESVHGWFGVGMRIGCWEDLVLSEGVADYLMVRAMGVVKGAEMQQSMFAAMEKSVASKVGTSKDVVVWRPATCDAIDVEKSGVSGKITYHKGALFLRAVAQQVGFAKVDAALGVFVKANLGQAKRFGALLDTLEAETGFDPRPLAKTWLEEQGDPLN